MIHFDILDASFLLRHTRLNPSKITWRRWSSMMRRAIRRSFEWEACIFLCSGFGFEDRDEWLRKREGTCSLPEVWEGIVPVDSSDFREATAELAQRALAQ